MRARRQPLSRMPLCTDAVFIVAVVDGEVKVLCGRAADDNQAFPLHSHGHRWLQFWPLLSRAHIKGRLSRHDFLRFWTDVTETKTEKRTKTDMLVFVRGKGVPQSPATIGNKAFHTPRVSPRPYPHAVRSGATIATERETIDDLAPWPRELLSLGLLLLTLLVQPLLAHGFLFPPVRASNVF